MTKFIIGIDEAGRGPLAGPVAIGICKIPKSFNIKKFERIFGVLKDSKKLSEKRREKIFLILKELKKKGELDVVTVLISEKVIDAKGISFAIRKGIESVLKNVGAEFLNSQILLDGSLSAPKEFVNQKTIIKGDELEWTIALASIVAKVTRDRYMEKISKDYTKYGFEIHKGYGTKSHREAIKMHGLSSVHRKTFCKNLI